IERIRDLYEEIAAKSRKAMEEGEDDTGTPFVHFDNTNGEHNEARLKHRKRPAAHRPKKQTAH
ncbi:MAG TPA: hypothetical protein VK961_10700, partial [Chthoniobacter sp.]|nr:hypothetical protein [Chthoniobacter sp.]